MVKETLLVIVGAGASFDCKRGPSVPNTRLKPVIETVYGSRDWEPREWQEVRPPVTAQLVDPSRVVFNEILNDYPHGQAVVDYLRRRLQQGRDPTTLEQALLEYSRSGSANPNVPGQLKSFLWYLRDVLLVCERYMLAPTAGGLVTNYTYLVNEALQWAYRVDGRVAFVSFNYDTFLERALEGAAPGVFYRGDIATYVNRERFDLFKPHGSGIWLYGDTSGHEHEIRAVVGEASLRESGSRPAMALPVMPKTDLVWNEHHEDRFRQVAPQITRIISVGWRAADEGFVNVLQSSAGDQSLRTTAVVGPNDAEAQKSVYNALAPVRSDGGAPVNVTDLGFTKWLDANGLDDALL